jgi:hypothetical protein
MKPALPSTNGEKKDQLASWIELRDSLAGQIQALVASKGALDFIEIAAALHKQAVQFFVLNVQEICATIKTSEQMREAIEKLASTWMPWGWPELTREMQKPLGRSHNPTRRKVRRITADRFIRDHLVRHNEKKWKEIARKAIEDGIKEHGTAPDGDVSEYHGVEYIIKNLNNGRLRCDIGFWIALEYREFRRLSMEKVTAAAKAKRDEIRTFKNIRLHFTNGQRKPPARGTS